MPDLQKRKSGLRLKTFGAKGWVNEWSAAFRFHWWTLMQTHNMSSRMKHIFDFMFLVCGLALFSWLFITNIGGKLNNPYVSIGGTSGSQVCEEVPSPIHGDFSADINGNLAGTSGYDVSKSTFRMSVPTVSLTTDEYKTMIAGFATAFNAIGERAKVRPGLWAIIAWASFYAQDKKTKTIFKPDMDPALFFADSLVMNNHPRSKGGVCNQPTYMRHLNDNGEVIPPVKDTMYAGRVQAAMFIDFDTEANNDLEKPERETGFAKNWFPTHSYPMSADKEKFTYKIYMSRAGYWKTDNDEYSSEYDEAYEGPCPDQFHPDDTFEYPPPLLSLEYMNDAYFPNEPSSNPNKMEVDVDIRSLLIVAAVNMGIIDISMLMQVGITEAIGDGVWHTYQHPHHFSKDGFMIVCAKAGSKVESSVGNSDNSDITLPSDQCFLMSANALTTQSLFYPFLQSTTELLAVDKPCTCNADCNSMQLSLFYARNGDASGPTSVAAVLGQKLKDDPVNGDLEQAKLVNALYKECSGELENGASIPSTSECKAAWDAIAGSSDEADGLGMFTMTMMPQTSMQMKPTQFSYSTLLSSTGFKGNLKDGSHPLGYCHDSLSQPDAFAKLASDVPVPLVESYFSCRPSTFVAVKTEVGNSFGAVMLFVNAGITFLIIFVAAIDRNESYHSAFVPGSRKRGQKLPVPGDDDDNEEEEEEEEEEEDEKSAAAAATTADAPPLPSAELVYMDNNGSTNVTTVTRGDAGQVVFERL